MIAVGGFVIAFEALLGALITLCFGLVAWQVAQPLGYALADLLRGVPGVGDSIANWITSAINTFSQSLQNWVSGVVSQAEQPIVDSLNTAANNQRVNAYSTRYVQEHVINQLNRLTLAQSETVSQPVANAINTTTIIDETRTNTIVSDNYEQSIGYTRDSYTQLADWANTAVQSVYNDVVDADNRIQATDTQLTDTINAVRDTLFRAVSETAAETLFEANHHSDENLVTSTILAEDVLQQSKDEANQARTDAIQTAANMVGPISEALTGVTVLVNTLVIPAVDELENFNKNCGIPVCDNLLKFAEGFLGVGKLIGSAALIAFLVELARDPDGTARTVIQEADALIETPLGIFNDVFGTHIGN